MALPVSGVTRFADRFVPPGMMTDERTHRRARLVVFFTAALVVWGPIFAFAFHAVGSTELALDIMAVSLFTACAPLVMKWTGSFPAATAMVLLPGYVLIAIFAHVTGGADSPALLWCLPPPLLALTLAGKRWALFWAFVSALEITVTGASFDTTSHQSLSPLIAQVFDSSDHISVMILLLSVFWAYESTQRTLDKRVDDTLASVAKTHRETQEGNDELRLILDNVHQGLLTVEIDGSISNARSAASDALFGAPEPGVHLSEYVGAVDPKAGQWLELGWEALAEGTLPLELALDQLPRKARVGSRHLAIEYSPIVASSGVVRVLVVVSDMTDAFERQRAERDQSELSAVVAKLITDRIGFAEFFAEGAALVARLASSVAADALQETRELHTLKGNAATFGATSVAEVCHDLESAIRDGGDPLSLADRGRLSAAWVSLARRLRAFGWNGQGRSVEVDERDIDAVCTAVTAGASKEAVVELVRSFQFEAGELRFARFGDQARSLARRLGKGDIAIEIDDGGLKFDPVRWAGFWSSFVHAVRNAVDHGLETDEERQDGGKDGAGRLAFRSGYASGKVTIELSDDGRGIDWDEVERRALETGLDVSTPAALELALFADGLTTRNEVTDVSGRGVGLSSLYEACHRLGGTLSVISKRGVGTTLVCELPALGVKRPDGISTGAATSEAPRRCSVRDASYSGNVSPMR